MVDSSVGGSCRCHEDSEDSKGCCSPQVFTSILLGILACVLMTGGVFLAFHRWDPLWLIVSGVGVLLVLIGSILHCCAEPSGGSGKSRPPHTDHPLQSGHPILNNGSLTEQLLPLSNARSVSQLSLNMLPGYFPPVVTAYGIEQHSAVIQNINRVVQQQNPGVTSGKSFLLLSLPPDSPPANLQNLVGTVYQLDESSVTEPPSADITSPAPLVLKNAEVQTLPSNELVQNSALSPSTSGVAQTENTTEIVNLMDCLSDIPSNCDSTQNGTSLNQNTNIQLSNPPVLVDVSSTSPDSANLPQSSFTETTPELSAPTISDPSETAVLMTVNDSATIDIPETTSNVLVDISDSINNPGVTPEAITNREISVQGPPSNNMSESNSTTEPVPDDSANVASEQPMANTELLISSDNLSDVDEELDDELLSRSSPPPSYDDVAQVGENAIGAFGLAYGTI